LLLILVCFFLLGPFCVLSLEDSCGHAVQVDPLVSVVLKQLLGHSLDESLQSLASAVHVTGGWVSFDAKHVRRFVIFLDKMPDVQLVLRQAAWAEVVKELAPAVLLLADLHRVLDLLCLLLGHRLVLVDLLRSVFGLLLLLEPRVNFLFVCAVFF